MSDDGEVVEKGLEARKILAQGKVVFEEKRPQPWVKNAK